MEAELATDRFIDVEEGKKQSYDHTRNGPETVAGNYGVYTSEGLLVLDIDDFSSKADIDLIETLPETFTVSTPHDGEHRYFRAGSEVVGVVTAQSGGSRSPSFPWGELYTSKYVVGPGSEIIGCDKSECYSCKGDDPGRYVIDSDRSIATISVEEVAALFQRASDTSADSGRQGSIAEFRDDPSEPSIPKASPQTATREELSSSQERLTAFRSGNGPRSRVWGLLLELARDGTDEGAKITEVLDLAEAMEIGRYQASEILMDWLDVGAVRKSEVDNYVVPQKRRWEQ